MFSCSAFCRSYGCPPSCYCCMGFPLLFCHSLFSSSSLSSPSSLFFFIIFLPISSSLVSPSPLFVLLIISFSSLLLYHPLLSSSCLSCPSSLLIFIVPLFSLSLYHPLLSSLPSPASSLFSPLHHPLLLISSSLSSPSSFLFLFISPVLSPLPLHQPFFFSFFRRPPVVGRTRSIICEGEVVFDQRASVARLTKNLTSTLCRWGGGWGLG